MNEKQEALARLLGNYPRQEAYGGNISDKTMFGWARELGRQVAVRVYPAAHGDGWYVQDSGGVETVKVSDFTTHPIHHRPVVYRVYETNGTLTPAYLWLPKGAVEFKFQER